MHRVDRSRSVSFFVFGQGTRATHTYRHRFRSRSHARRVVDSIGSVIVKNFKIQIISSVRRAVQLGWSIEGLEKVRQSYASLPEQNLTDSPSQGIQTRCQTRDRIRIKSQETRAPQAISRQGARKVRYFAIHPCSNS
jgi:hypothetical protein